jgi:O-antigen ligase
VTAETRNSTILTASFLLWCVLLTYPLMTVSRDYGLENRVILYQIIGFGQYAVIAVALYASRMFRLLSGYDHLQNFILLTFLLSIGLQLHGDGALILGGIAYTIALILVILLLSLLFTLPDKAIAGWGGGAAAVFLSFAVVAIALFGWPKDRYVGEIHPNFTGSILLAGFIFAQFRKGLPMLLVKAGCLVLSAVVSSRFAMIGCVLAFLVFEMTFKPLNPRLLLLIGLFAVGGALFSNQLLDVLALDDPARGVNSGFTGRTDEWASALDSLASNPFGVGFKRAVADVEGRAIGHNGYLKVLLEFGILGGGLINLAVIAIVLRAPFTAIMSPNGDSVRRRILCARAAGLVALAFASLFQPQIFNFGDAHGISCMLLLFAPRLARARRLAPGGPIVPYRSRPAGHPAI